MLLALLLTGLSLNAGEESTPPSTGHVFRVTHAPGSFAAPEALGDAVVWSTNPVQPRRFPPPPGTPAAIAPFFLASDVRHPAARNPYRVAGVLHGLRAFDAYSRTVLGAPIRKPVTVVLAQRSRCLWPQAGAAGLAWGHTICLFTHEPRSGGSRLAADALVAAHEAAHVLLNAEAGCLRPGRQIPQWLIEGMAEDLAWRVIEPDADLASRRLRARARARADRRLRPHQFSYGDAEYRVLNLERDRPRALVRFCRTVDDGTPWPAAARQAFGPVAAYI